MLGRQASRRRARRARVVPRHQRRRCSTGTEHERRVADVRLDDERADADQPRQHDDVAVGERPRQQHVREERQHGDPRVPRVDEQVGVVGERQHEEQRGDERSQRHAAAAPGDDQGADDRRRVEHGDADEDARRAEQPVERREQPEQERSGMIPAVPGVDAGERRVAPADVVDLEELDGQVGRRVPMPADERQRRRDHRGEREHDESGEHDVRAVRWEPARPRHSSSSCRRTDVIKDRNRCTSHPQSTVSRTSTSSFTRP